MTMSSWSDLPDDLINLITQNFTIMNDLVRFGAVCVSWQNHLSQNRTRHLPRKIKSQLPVLMVHNIDLKKQCYYQLSSAEKFNIRDGKRPVDAIKERVRNDDVSVGTDDEEGVSGFSIRGQAKLVIPEMVGISETSDTEEGFRTSYLNSSVDAAEESVENDVLSVTTDAEEGFNDGVSGLNILHVAGTSGTANNRVTSMDAAENDAISVTSDTEGLSDLGYLHVPIAWMSDTMDTVEDVLGLEEGFKYDATSVTNETEEDVTLTGTTEITDTTTDTEGVVMARMIRTLGTSTDTEDGIVNVSTSVTTDDGKSGLNILHVPVPVPVPVEGRNETADSRDAITDAVEIYTFSVTTDTFEGVSGLSILHAPALVGTIVTAQSTDTITNAEENDAVSITTDTEEDVFGLNVLHMAVAVAGMSETADTMDTITDAEENVADSVSTEESVLGLSMLHVPVAGKSRPTGTITDNEDKAIELGEFPVVVPSDEYFAGSSYGYVVLAEGGRYCTYRLVNPFLVEEDGYKNEIDLPPMRTVCTRDSRYSSSDFDISKLAVSDNPMFSDDFIVMIIFGKSSDLAFWKAGNLCMWKVIKQKEHFFQDVVFYRDKFYAVDHIGVVFSVEIESCGFRAKVRTVARSPPEDRGSKIYLVESLGDLLQVRRVVRFLPTVGETTDFIVYKLLEQPTEDEENWIRMDTLDGQALFLGDNSSLSRSATAFPGCKPNCIYFTDDYRSYCNYSREYGPQDLGVFNVEERKFDDCLPIAKFKGMMPQPIWVEQALFGCN